MKKSGRVVLLYSAGIAMAIAVTALASSAVDYKWWAYHYFRGDYVKTGQVYDLMIARPYSVENLFMGSSHTLNGVDDQLIARAFGRQTASYNAAIPTSGRDFEYVVLKDILTRSPPKRLYLEVRETEERTSHFGFPVVASLYQIVTAPPNPWWPRNALYALQYRFEHLTWLLPALRREELAAPSQQNFGYMPAPHQLPYSKVVAEAAETKATKRWHELPAMFGDIEFSANEHYVQEIADLCRREGVELHFIYLPFLGGPAEPLQAKFYRSLGTLHLMPDALRNNPNYFADPTHFNPKGAEAYTRWLIEYVLRPSARADSKAFAVETRAPK